MQSSSVYLIKQHFKGKSVIILKDLRDNRRALFLFILLVMLISGSGTSNESKSVLSFFGFFLNTFSIVVIVLA